MEEALRQMKLEPAFLFHFVICSLRIRGDERKKLYAAALSATMLGKCADALHRYVGTVVEKLVEAGRSGVADDEGRTGAAAVVAGFASVSRTPEGQLQVEVLPVEEIRDRLVFVEGSIRVRCLHSSCAGDDGVTTILTDATDKAQN